VFIVNQPIPTFSLFPGIIVRLNLGLVQVQAMDETEGTTSTGTSEYCHSFFLVHCIGCCPCQWLLWVLYHSLLQWLLSLAAVVLVAVVIGCCICHYHWLQLLSCLAVIGCCDFVVVSCYSFHCC